MASEWKLVPVELTDEMAEASGCDGYFRKSAYDQAQDMWSAMLAAAPAVQGEPLRYTNDGALAECPCCGSLEVGGAHDTVHCYSCDLTVTKPRPLQNAIDAWNTRTGRTHPAPAVQGEPVAYAVFASNGNIRIWCADPVQVETLRQQYGDQLTPLYEHPAAERPPSPSDEEMLSWAGEEQFFLFCDRDEFLQIARAVLERFGMADAYSGAAEDKEIWKKRALEAEAALRQEKETSARLCNALNHESGPTNMGEPVLPKEGQSWSGWACQAPGRMPRLYGSREIAELNFCPESGDRLFFLSEPTEQQPDVTQLVEALDGAARSLETISRLAGIDEYMRDFLEVRGYARNRALVAFEALAAYREQGGDAL